MTRRSVPGLALLALLAMLTLVSCSDDEPSTTSAAAPATSAAASSVDATSTSTPTLQTPTAPPEIVMYGKRFSVTYYECADKLWTQRVAQWNQLTDAQRDQWPDSEAWMKSKGWPATQEATLLAPATRKACPPGR